MLFNRSSFPGPRILIFDFKSLFSELSFSILSLFSSIKTDEDCTGREYMKYRKETELQKEKP